MSVQGEIAEYCITLLGLSDDLDASIIDGFLKDNGVPVSEGKLEIPGDGEKKKWIVRLKTTSDVERLVNDVKEWKFNHHGDQDFQVQIGRAEWNDVPRNWSIHPKSSGSPKDTHPKMPVNFAVSGFFENYRPTNTNPGSRPDFADSQQNHGQPSPGRSDLQGRHMDPGQTSQGHDPQRGQNPQQNIDPHGGFPTHAGHFPGSDKGQGNIGPIITLVNPHTGEKVPGYFDPQLRQYIPLPYTGMPQFGPNQYPQGQAYPMPLRPTGPPPPYNSGGRGPMEHATYHNPIYDLVKRKDDAAKQSKAVADQQELLDKFNQKKAKEEEDQEYDQRPHASPNQSFSPSTHATGEHHLSSSTLKVSDIPPNAGADFIETFFEDLTKMKVKRVAVNGKEAIVEFLEPKGAQLAMQDGQRRQLKMEGHPIYIEIMSEESPHENPKPSFSTVQVKANVSYDLIEIYFESKKRSGGGEIEEIKCVENGVYLVTFTEEEAATRVVKRDRHEINGQLLEVELYNPHEEEDEEEDEQDSTTSTQEPFKVVVVRGVQNVGDRDTIEMYFESKKRSGGGDIEKIEEDENDSDVIYITFEDAEVAKTVTERNHIINGQQLKTWLYDPRQKEDEEEEDVGPLCTVIVRGVQKVGSQDVLEMYFESKKRSGGGEIEEMRPDEDDEDVLYITYVEEEVAQVVADRSHKINGQEVETFLYDPRQDKQEEEEDVGPLCTVCVRGVQKIGSMEVLEMYFESKKRSKGGEIEEMRPDENDEDVLYITFVEEDVAKTVAESSHKINGEEVETWLYDPRQEKQEEEDVGPLCTVIVRGVQKVGSQDVLKMYFESKKRSGGGEIEEMRPDEDDEDVLYITYVDEEVSKSIVSRSPHTVNGQQLHVELFFPKSKKQPTLICKREEVGEADDKKEEEYTGPKCIVKVKGVKNIRSIEAMLLFFENSSRSGGGEIETSYPDKENKDIFFIKFTSEEDAAGVVNKSPHIVEYATLLASIYIPPKPLPSYPDRILIQGVKSSTTQDCLFNFLEAKSGAVPEKMSYGAEEGVVMVTFQSNPDFSKLYAIDGKSLEGSVLRLSPVTISNCIHVADLKETTSQDTVQFYFENERRSGGGEVDKVILNKEEDCALVYFPKFEMVERVLARKHVIDRQDVVVRRYFDCLGCPEGDGKEPPFKVPDPITVYNVDLQKIKFFNNSNTNKAALEKQMSNEHAKIIWPREKGANKIILECTLTSEVQQYRKLAKRWKQKAEESFRDFFNQIMVITLNLTQATWDDVMKRLNSVSVDNPDAIAVFTDKKNGAICVTGLGPVTNELAQVIKGFIKEVEDEVEKKKRIF